MRKEGRYTREGGKDVGRDQRKRKHKLCAGHNPHCMRLGNLTMKNILTRRPMEKGNEKKRDLQPFGGAGCNCRGCCLFLESQEKKKTQDGGDYDGWGLWAVGEKGRSQKERETPKETHYQLVVAMLHSYYKKEKEKAGGMKEKMLNQRKYL